MTEMSSILARLADLESREQIRFCINRYMEICDTLSSRTPWQELGELFTTDAIWHGAGARYRDTFGAFHGRNEILSMLRTYATEPAHFSLNVHFLTSEQIRVKGDQADASWLMLQTSTFASGRSHLNSARLDVKFSQLEGSWRIADFRTENLFSRPVDSWNSSAELPVPERNDSNSSERKEKS